MSAAKQYTGEINQGLGYLATWLPGVPIALGSIGTIDRHNAFVSIGNLSSQGITFDTVRDTTSEDLSYESKGGLEWSVKLAGDTSDVIPHVPKADAGLAIKFKREGAVAFHASGLTTHRIPDQIALAQSVAAQMAAEQWDRDWLIVTEVFEAEQATILVSNSEQSSVEFNLGADVSVGGVKILSADAEASVAHAHDMATKILNQNGLTPLFRVVRAKKKWYSTKWKLVASYSADLESMATGREFDPEDLFDPITKYELLDL